MAFLIQVISANIDRILMQKYLIAIDLLTKMLAKDPKVRISAKECLEHPWIVGGGGGSDGQNDHLHPGMLSSAQENMKRFQNEYFTSFRLSLNDYYPIGIDLM